MTFVLQTPRAVSFCVHWIFVFTRLRSAASVQHPAGRSAECRERSALNFVNPCPAAELSWCGLVPALRGASVLLRVSQIRKKISRRLVAAGVNEMLKGWANMDI